MFSNFSFARIVSVAAIATLISGCGGGHAITPQLPSVNQQQMQSGAVGSHHIRYRLIDMGTFGGPSSQASSLNLQGDTTVVGWSALSFNWGPTSHPLICGGSDHFIQQVTHAFQWRKGRVIDLGSLGGVTSCSIPAQAFPNARGEVVGNSENGAFDPQTGVNQSRAVLWEDGKIHDLGSFGGNQNGAAGINDRGQVVGVSLNTIPDPLSLFDQFFFGSTKGTQTRAFLWEHGHMQDLGTLGTGKDAAAFYINQRGQVAGISYTSMTPNPATGLPTVDPFLWTNGHMIDLGSLGGTIGFANAMNDRGEVVGQSNLAGDATGHAFYSNGSKMIDLGTAGGTVGVAWAINNSGEVVGWTTNTGDQQFVAFVWKNGVRTDLPPLPGDCGSQAFGIDSSGRIVGNSLDCRFTFPINGADHVVIWDHGSVIDVNELVSKNASLQIAQVGPLSQAGPGVINDRGEIAGIGVPPGVPRWQAFISGRAFLLIPCGEKDSRCSDAGTAGRTSAAEDTLLIEQQLMATPPRYERRLGPYRLRILH
jgi:probable HAF family extracellular repeat protein